MSLKKTTEQFIEEAKKIHGDDYIYTLSKYDGKDVKVCIICPKHGEFWQTPHNHIQGKQGCPQCKKEKLSILQRSNMEEFIEKAREIHGDKYKYRGTYVNNRTPIEIICPTHGTFKQAPHTHLGGHGCPLCAKNHKLDTEAFITQSTAIHKGRYTYEDTDYKNATTKVKINCPIHGQFEQIPYYHLQGHGCPKCNMSNLERDIMNLLDEKKIEYIYQCNKKTLPWLNRQSLDFYLPKHNIAIECQGEQHYIKHSLFESLENNKARDKRKQNKCAENNIKVLYYADEQYKELHELGNFFSNKDELLKTIANYGND